MKIKKIRKKLYTILGIPATLIKQDPNSTYQSIPSFTDGKILYFDTQYVVKDATFCIVDNIIYSLTVERSDLISFYFCKQDAIDKTEIFEKIFKCGFYTISDLEKVLKLLYPNLERTKGYTDIAEPSRWTISLDTSNNSKCNTHGALGSHIIFCEDSSLNTNELNLSELCGNVFMDRLTWKHPKKIKKFLRNAGFYDIKFSKYHTYFATDDGVIYFDLALEIGGTEIKTLENFWTAQF